MRVLALDTTTRAGSVALAVDGTVLEVWGTDPTLPPASRLPGDLISLLERHRTRLGDIDVFAVVQGPGSFTGLRVGIATMQGLALAHRRPLIGVSGLDALARSVAETAPAARVVTWVDAWRGEVYAALFDHGVLSLPPTVDRPLDWLAGIVDGAGELLFVGDGVQAHRSVVEEVFGSRARFHDPCAPLIAGAVARMATEATTAGQQPSPAAISPLYLRRPDAELARSRARGRERPTEARRP